MPYVAYINRLATNECSFLSSDVVFNFFVRNERVQLTRLQFTYMTYYFKFKGE
jgi:hypothetical protein